MSEYYSVEELEELPLGREVADEDGHSYIRVPAGFSSVDGITIEVKHFWGLIPKPVSILTEAQDTISTDRQADYGDAQVSFKRIADLWSTYLATEVSAQDVACLMALMKISRIKGDPSKRDSWVDLAGYAGLGGELG